MRMLLIWLEPIGPSDPGGMAALAREARARGHELFVAAPPLGAVDELRQELGAMAFLPLLPVQGGRWLPFVLNLYRVAYWARRWRPTLYLSAGGLAATLAHAGRGACRGYGFSVLLLPALRFPPEDRVGTFLERRAIQESDRLITCKPEMGERLVADYGARGGDLVLLGDDTEQNVLFHCERFLAEPPGFHYS